MYVMTKYGHESGTIAISQFRKCIDSGYYLSTKIIQIQIFPYLTLSVIKYACQAKPNHFEIHIYNVSF